MCVALTFFVGSSWSLEKKKEMRWTANIFTDKNHHKVFQLFFDTVSVRDRWTHFTKIRKNVFSPPILSTLLGVISFYVCALIVSCRVHWADTSLCTSSMINSKHNLLSTIISFNVSDTGLLSVFVIVARVTFPKLWTEDFRKLKYLKSPLRCTVSDAPWPH